MAWIESHQTLARHPKTRKLARMLEVSVPQAIGHLHCLWWWSMDYAQEGDLSDYDNADIADAAMWEGDPDVFVCAMAGCGAGGSVGFLEVVGSGYHIHDWHEYAGKLIERRRVDADRKRESRRPADSEPTLLDGDTPSIGHPQDIPRTAHVPNQPTKPNRTKPTQPTGTVLEFDSFFEDVWRRYPTREGVGKIGKAETRALVKALPPAEWPDVLKAVINYAASGRLPVDPIRFFKSRDYPAGLWRQFVNGGNNGNNGANRQSAVEIAGQEKPKSRVPGLREALEERARQAKGA